MKSLQAKNVWILNHYAKTPDLAGGTRHYDFARELIKRGYEVTIFASSFDHLRLQELKLSEGKKYKIENINGVDFIWLKTHPYYKNDWRRVLSMFSYMWRSYWLGRKVMKTDKRIKKPDVIIGSSVHLLAVLSAHWLAKYHKAKFIMEVRDLWPQTLIDMGKLKENSPIVKILRFLEKYLYQKAQKIIVLMYRADKYLIPLGIKKNKIEWICNGADLSRFTGLYDKKEQSGIFEVMYFGAHGMANGLENVLEAAKIIQDKNYKEIAFSLYGNGPEKNGLIEHKKMLGLENLEFFEPVSKNKAAEIIARADILLDNYKHHNALKYGTSHNKLFEYMASAKPVIYTSDEKDNLVDISECGVSVPFENPQALADAILSLYKKNPAEREKMGQRGRAYVEKYYSIPILVDKLEKLIKEASND